MDDWRAITLQDLSAPLKNALVGGPFGSDLVSNDYVAKGVPVIRGQNLSLGRWVAGDFAYVSEDKAERLSANSAKPGDIIFTQRGANHYKQVAIVPELGVQKYIISQSQMKLTVDERVADPLFVFYMFQDAPQRDYLMTNAIATGVPHTNLGILRSVPLRIPPLETQKQIAGVVGALDDKIELNRRTAAVLEEMARALYRSWFVDFDPVRARSEGRPPAHMSPATASLFPDSFGDNGLPEGWAMEPLAKHVSVARGLSYKGSGLCEADAGVPLHNLNSVFEGGGYKTAGIKYYSGDFKPRHEIVPGELIVTNTEQGFDLLLMGHAALVPHHFGPTGLFSQHIYKVAPKAKSPLSREWLYLMLSVSPKGQEIRSYSNGTTVNMLPMDALEIPEVLIPPQSVVDAFDAAVKPTFARKESVEVENQTLATLRDTLLPKLMSGELRVGAARDMAEAL